MKKSFKVAYVGLTHLGLNYLAASSEKGFEIVGVDINQNKIDKLNQFKVDYNEPNLRRVILKNKKNIIIIITISIFLFLNRLKDIFSLK